MEEDREINSIFGNEYINQNNNQNGNSNKNPLSLKKQNNKQYMYEKLKQETKNSLYIQDKYMISKRYLKKWKKANNFLLKSESKNKSFYEFNNDHAVDNDDDDDFDETINSDLFYFNDGFKQLKPNLKENVDYKLISQELWELIIDNNFKEEFKVKVINGHYEINDKNVVFIRKTRILHEDGSEKTSFCKNARISVNGFTTPADIFQEINSLYPPHNILPSSGPKPKIYKNDEEKPLRVWILYPEIYTKNHLRHLEEKSSSKGKAYIHGKLLKIDWLTSLNEMIKNEEFDKVLIEIKDECNFFLFNDNEYITGKCDNCDNELFLPFICSCKLNCYCSEKCLKEDVFHKIKNPHDHDDNSNMQNANQNGKNGNNDEKIINKNNFIDIKQNKEEFCSQTIQNFKQKIISNNYKEKITKKKSFIGLKNLGNTCYMNAAIQCLNSVSNLTDFLLSKFENDRDLKNNEAKPKETKFILHYYTFLKTLKTPNTDYISPQLFKYQLSMLNAMFTGYLQHDAQELILIILDALHEGLKTKLYPDQEAIKFYEKFKSETENKFSDEKEGKFFQDYLHAKEGNTIISDLFQGIYKSQIKCNVCQKISRNYDPFTICSLPIFKRSMKVIEFFFEKLSPTPVSYKIILKYHKQSKNTIGDLKNYLAKHYNINPANLMAKNVDSKKNNSVLSENSLLEAIRKTIIYKPKILIRELNENELNIDESNRLVVNIVLKVGTNFSKSLLSFKEYNQFLLLDQSKTLDKIHYDIFFYLKQHVPLDFDINDKNFEESKENLPYIIKIVPEETYAYFFEKTEQNNVLPYSKDQTLSEYLVLNKKNNDNLLVLNAKLKDSSTIGNFENLTEETFNLNSETAQNSTIYDCLDLMTMEESLDESNKWLCSDCKINQLCSKKLEIYETGPILILHLKRNKQTPIRKKINTKINFPLNSLDLNKYIISNEKSKIYDLFAICNHYGNPSQGHYTAYCKSNDNLWYFCDDEKVEFVENLDKMISESAYILFYKRKEVIQNDNEITN